MKKLLITLAIIATTIGVTIVSGCKKGAEIYDTTPIPTDQPITLTVPPPTP